jgi:AraC family L-rhamnose operon regulatory protein RhaS
VGVTALVEYVRAQANLSPMKYLNRCRIEHAGRLLREQPGRSITDVAFDCGFSSSQYFASQFRLHFGCTPRAYRKSVEPSPKFRA